jgi:hypothetical protein
LLSFLQKRKEKSKEHRSQLAFPNSKLHWSWAHATNRIYSLGNLGYYALPINDRYQSDETPRFPAVQYGAN